MIFKTDLIEAINSLNDDVNDLFKAVNDIETRLDRVERKIKHQGASKLEKAIGEATTPKRRGRPAGAKSKTQPRDKSGKFIKE